MDSSLSLGMTEQEVQNDTAKPTTFIRQHYIVLHVSVKRLSKPALQNQNGFDLLSMRKPICNCRSGFPHNLDWSEDTLILLDIFLKS